MCHCVEQEPWIVHIIVNQTSKMFWEDKTDCKSVRNYTFVIRQ